VLQNYCDDITPTNVNELHGLYLLPTATPTNLTKNPRKKRRMLDESSRDAAPHGVLARFGPASSESQFYDCEEGTLYKLLCQFEETAQTLVSAQIPVRLIKCFRECGSIPSKVFSLLFSIVLCFKEITHIYLFIQALSGTFRCEIPACCTPYT
jgi:hypothetical protein